MNIFTSESVCEFGILPYFVKFDLDKEYFVNIIKIRRTKGTLNSRLRRESFLCKKLS